MSKVTMASETSNVMRSVEVTRAGPTWDRFCFILVSETMEDGQILPFAEWGEQSGTGVCFGSFENVLDAKAATDG